MDQLLNLFMVDSAETLALPEIIVRVSVSFILASISAKSYEYIQKRERATAANLPYTMVLFGVIVCGMMMLVGNSLARAFGLFGALSILRFRINLRNPIDGAAILFTITMGIACGIGMLHMAIIFCLFILAVFMILHLHKEYRYRTKRKIVLKAKNNSAVRHFLAEIKENYNVSYEIMGAENWDKSNPIWNITLYFPNPKVLQRWEAWLASQRQLIFSHHKYEMNLDLGGWKPDKEDRDSEDVDD